MFIDTEGIIINLTEKQLFCFKDADQAPVSGNLFLDNLFGADVYFVPKSASYIKELKPRMEKIAQHIR